MTCEIYNCALCRQQRERRAEYWTIRLVAVVAIVAWWWAL